MQKVVCPYCGRVAKYVDSSVIYYGHSYGMAYLCRPCNAYVGVHSGTDRPKAILKRCREQNILSVDAYRAEKENHAAAAAARAAPAARPQSKQAAVRERLKKRLEEMGGAQSDDPADNRIYVEATELVAEPLPGE